MIKPGNRSFLGGGLFADMFKDAAAMICDYIVLHGEQRDNIIHAPLFEQYFTVKGAVWKNMPRGYDKEHPQAEFLKYKSWYLNYPVTDEQLLSEDFLSFTTGIYEAMQPFHALFKSSAKIVWNAKRP